MARGIPEEQVWKGGRCGKRGTGFPASCRNATIRVVIPLVPPLQVINEVMLADQPTRQFVKPEDLAAMVLHLCGPHSSSITGACLSVDGGWTAR